MAYSGHQLKLIVVSEENPTFAGVMANPCCYMALYSSLEPRRDPRPLQTFRSGLIPSDKMRALIIDECTTLAFDMESSRYYQSCRRVNTEEVLVDPKIYHARPKVHRRILSMTPVRDLYSDGEPGKWHAKAVYPYQVFGYTACGRTTTQVFT